jgi:hypothetical protein
MGIDSMLPEAGQDVISRAAGINQGQENRFQAQVAQVLCYIPADAAVHIPDFSGVPASRDIGAGRIPLDIHKDGTDDDDTHMILFFPLFFILPQKTDEKQPENSMIENCMIQYEMHNAGGGGSAWRSKG